MFNEILTGKASVEDKPVVPPPTAPAQDSAAAIANAQASARAYAESAAQRERASNSHKVLAAGLLIAAGIGLMIFKYGYRKQQEADMRAAYGVATETPYDISYTHPFVMQAREFAKQMCACRDEKCAWKVQETFDHWARTTMPPKDGAILDAAAVVTDRYAECLAKWSR